MPKRIRPYTGPRPLSVAIAEMEVVLGNLTRGTTEPDAELQKYPGAAEGHMVWCKNMAKVVRRRLQELRTMSLTKEFES